MSIAFGNVRTTKKMVQTFIILSPQGILVLLLFAVGMLQQWKSYILDLAHECSMFKRSTEPCHVSKIEDSD